MSEPLTQLPEGATLIRTLGHTDFKAFGKEAFAIKNRARSLTVVLVLVSFMGFSAVLAFSVVSIFTKGDWSFFVQVIAAFGVMMLVLLPIHEGLHALAYKAYGSKSIYFGWDWKKFIAYAAADREYYNGRQFKVIALLPFLSITMLLGMMLLLLPQFFMLWLSLLCIHNLSCQGDFSLVIFMNQYAPEQFLTVDFRDTKETHFYLLKREG